jgi:drug/metabolite transporter (DMT)-like permease
VANTRAVSVVLACAAVSAIGSSFVASSKLVDYPFLSGQAIRYGAGALALFLYTRAYRVTLVAPTRREWGRLFVLGGVGQAGFNLAVLAALRTASPTAVGAVVGCVPIVLAVLGPLLARQLPQVRVVIAAVVVVAGAGLVQGVAGTDLVGFAFAVAALIAEAAFSLIAVPLLPRLGPTAVSLNSCVAASVLLAVAATVVDRGHALELPTPTEAFALGYLALVVTAAAFVWWYRALLDLGAARMGLFAGLIPVAAAGCAALVGVSAFDPAQLAGCVIVAVGVVIGMSGSKERPGPLVRRRGGRRSLDAGQS